MTCAVKIIAKSTLSTPPGYGAAFRVWAFGDKGSDSEVWGLGIIVFGFRFRVWEVSASGIRGLRVLGLRLKI